jgi:hypothetical protein
MGSARKTDRVTHAPLRDVNDLEPHELRRLAAAVRDGLAPAEAEDDEPLLDVNGGDLVEALSEVALDLGLLRDESEVGRDTTRWCPRCAMHRSGEHVESESKKSSGGEGGDS